MCSIGPGPRSLMTPGLLLERSICVNKFVRVQEDMAEVHERRAADIDRAPGAGAGAELQPVAGRIAEDARLGLEPPEAQRATADGIGGEEQLPGVERPL